MGPRLPSVELILECSNPGALAPTVTRFLCIANMPFAVEERSREIAIVVTGIDETTVGRLHGALLRVAFAPMLDGVILRRHL